MTCHCSHDHRLNVLFSYRFRTFISCVQHTYRNEQLRGFWRGMNFKASTGYWLILRIQGVWAPLASVTLVRTVSFSIYQRVKYTYDRWIYSATGQSPLIIANTKGALPTPITMACFGAAGGTVGALVTVIACKFPCKEQYILLLTVIASGPFELTKMSAQISRLMANHGQCRLGSSLQDRGTFRTAQHLVRTSGIRGLYQGFHLHMRKRILHKLSR